MEHSCIQIQISPEALPSIPSRFGEVAVFAQVLAHVGMLKAVQEQVRFARVRFGTYDFIDFVVVLIGHAISSEPMRKRILRTARSICQSVHSFLWSKPVTPRWLNLLALWTLLWVQMWRWHSHQMFSF